MRARSRLLAHVGHSLRGLGAAGGLIPAAGLTPPPSSGLLSSRQVWKERTKEEKISI